ncbi:MAG: SCO family protein [Candidatus Tectomicrobia bacterium]|nr:SCO family protein [Candidatus Tectomicrobia bacterium]
MTMGGTERQTPGKLHEPQRSGRMVWSVMGSVFAVLIGFGVLVLLSNGFSGRASQSALPPIGEVPEFSLLERSGQPVTKGDLLGKVWVVDFIFTNCVEACPLLSSRMSELQTAFASEADLRLVSITLDPERDTPERLATYAAHLNAHPQRWLFLTGDKDRIYRLARKGFYLHVVDPAEAQQTSGLPPSLQSAIRQAASRMWRSLEPASALAHHGQHPADREGREDLQHSARLVLVDRLGQIRQYYDSRDADVVQRLGHDLKRLLREP